MKINDFRGEYICQGHELANLFTNGTEDSVINVFTTGDFDAGMMLVRRRSTDGKPGPDAPAVHHHEGQARGVAELVGLVRRRSTDGKPGPDAQQALTLSQLHLNVSNVEVPDAGT